MGHLWKGERHYDVQIGRPIQDAAAEERIAAGDPTVQHIGTLITADSFQYKNGHFTETLYKEPANKRQLIKIGQYARGALEDAAYYSRPDNQFTAKHYERMHVLRLAPTRRILMHFFPTLADYRQAFGEHQGRAPGIYADWKIPNWAKYAADIASSLPESRKLVREDIDTAYVKGDGPGLTIMRRHDITIGMMNEFIGYYDVEASDKFDLVHWGARVMAANEGKLNAYIIRVLSGRGKGPSTFSATQKFGGSLRNFFNQAEALRRNQLDREQKIHDDLSEIYAKLSKRNLLPINAESLSKIERYRLAAQYSLAAGCLPGKDAGTLAEIALEPPDKLKSAIRNQNLKLSFAFIEAAASKNKIHDIIWPEDEGLDELLVTDEEIANLRKRNSKLKRHQRSNS